MSLEYIKSIEKRIERLEFWQRIELIMLGSLISEKALEILLPLFA